MVVKPITKYAMGFFDAQNLYCHAKDAFGHIHPNFDPKALHAAVCLANGLTPNLTRFYTGVPDMSRAEMWTGYWNNRVMALKRAGVNVTTRKLRYHDNHVEMPDGTSEIVTSVQEKGVDVRLALDVVKLARLKNYDVAVIYSQDQDLCEVVNEVREIAAEHKRSIEIISAFPAGPGATSRRGIDRTQWFEMDETFYNLCLDPRDYRPAKN
jgi:uncharacterized LabA/DUF88 family protein